MGEAVLHLVRDFNEDLRGRRFSSPSITYDGEAVFLAMPPGPPTHSHWGPVYPEESGQGEYSCELLVCSHDTVTEIHLENIRVWLPRIQRLSQDEFLIVDIAGWAKDSTNAHVFTPGGHYVRSFRLPATEHVFTDRDGWIWGTFDDQAAGGTSRLIRVDAQGRTQWGFAENRGEAESVWMFEALNVSNEAVWACGETEFEIVRIKGDRVTRWKQDLPIDEIAVSEPYLLLHGAYHQGTHVFYLARLGDDGIEDIEDARLTLPDGRTLSEVVGLPVDRRQHEGVKVIGREDALHVFAENRWYRVRVQELLQPG